VGLLFKFKKLFGFKEVSLIYQVSGIYPGKMIGEIGKEQGGLVKLSEFEKELGNTRNQNSLMVQHSGYWP